MSLGVSVRYQSCVVGEVVCCLGLASRILSITSHQSLGGIQQVGCPYFRLSKEIKGGSKQLTSHIFHLAAEREESERE